MKQVFVDSDILLDVILNRPAFYNSASKFLSLANKGSYNCCTSVHTLLNVHYVTKKHLGAKIAKEAIELLIEQLQIITEDLSIIKQAISSNFSDFEDATQFFAAKDVGADFIITRNIKDYKHSTIPVLTAEQFLKQIL